MLNSWRDFCHCKVTIVKSRVEEIVKRCTGPKVLECGCNEGWLAKAIMEERGFAVTAIDNRQEACTQAKNYFNIDAMLANVESLPFPDNCFDCVLACELLEHLENPGKGLAEIFRVSKGHVILTLPLGAYWLDEKSHCWQLDGCVINHENFEKPIFEKHAILLEWNKKRTIVNGDYIDIK